MDPSEYQICTTNEAPITIENKFTKLKMRRRKKKYRRIHITIQPHKHTRMQTKHIQKKNPKQIKWNNIADSDGYVLRTLFQHDEFLNQNTQVDCSSKLKTWIFRRGRACVS